MSRTFTNQMETNKSGNKRFNKSHYTPKYYDNTDVLLAFGKVSEALDKFNTYVEESQDDPNPIAAHQMLIELIQIL